VWRSAGGRHLLAALQDLLRGSAQPWALIAIFALICAESAFLVGLLVPGETVVILAGAAAGLGLLHFSATTAVVISAAIAGDLVGYLIGRCWGRRLLAQWPYAARQFERYRPGLENHFQRWGAMTVLIGRFVAVGRMLTPFAAGLSGMPARRFVPIAVCAGALWAGVFEITGFLLGNNWPVIEQWLRPLGAGVIGLIVLTLAALWLWRWLRREQPRLVEVWNRLKLRPVALRISAWAAWTGQFARERLSPNRYLSLHLSVGLLIVVIAATLFGLIVNAILRQRPLVNVDAAIAAFVQQRATPTLDAVMRAIAWLRAPALLLGLSGVCALGFAIARKWQDAILTAACVCGAYAAALGLQEIFEGISRHIPVVAITGGFEHFPHASTAAATATYGILAYFAVAWLRNWQWITLAVVAAVYLDLLATIGALYQGAPLSAAIAGLILGSAWLTICITAAIAWDRLTRESACPASRPTSQPSRSR